MPATPRFKLTKAQYHELREEHGGICLSCGCLKYGGVEPDARGRLCEDGCGKKAVIGIEEAVTRGRIEFVSHKPKDSILAANLDPSDAEDSNFDD
jgi:hypothetical protein